MIYYQGLSFMGKNIAPWEYSGVEYFYYENWKFKFYFDMKSLKPVFINFNDSKFGHSYDEICFVTSDGYEERNFSKDEFKIKEYCNQKEAYSGHSTLFLD